MRFMIFVFMIIKNILDFHRLMNSGIELLISTQGVNFSRYNFIYAKKFKKYNL
jgi:hypothetical protein